VTKLGNPGEIMKKIIFTTSWDDGYSKDLKLANLLDKYGIKGTFYIPIRSINKWLSVDDLRTIAENHEIGAHTISHCILTETTMANARHEIIESKRQLERILNVKIDCFCYPNSKYNENIKTLVKNSGYLCARTIQRFCFTLPNDLFQMGTTLQVLNFKRDFLSILKITKSPLSSVRGVLDWEYLAKLLFDYTLNKGEVYHLWGHSWEIEKRGYWDKLENFLSYVAHRKNVEYLTNGEAVRKFLLRQKSESYEQNSKTK